MTQARSSSLQIILTPMQIPEIARTGLALSHSSSLTTEMDSLGSSLLIHPGEASEMVVHIKNLSSQSISFQLRVEGNFPSQWCHIGTEGQVIVPGGQMEAVLYFQVPANYFEDSQALVAAKQQLELDFRGQIVVCTDLERRSPTTYYQEFSLHLRPRSHLMQFLPVLYREVDFIGRFMQIFEQGVMPAIQSFSVMWANLDPLTAPVALLPFLAHWVGWKIDRAWTIPQQRRLIRQAVELYRWRGTRKGLRLYLHLYTGLPLDEELPEEADKHISITEPFGQGFILGDTELGYGAVLGGGRHFHFIVRLRRDRHHAIEEQLVRRIIEQEKPAFSTYELLIE